MKDFLGHWMGKVIVVTFAIALFADFYSRPTASYRDESLDSWEYEYEAMVPSGISSRDGVSWLQLTLLFWIVLGIVAHKLGERRAELDAARRRMGLK